MYASYASSSWPRCVPRGRVIGGTAAGGTVGRCAGLVLERSLMYFRAMPRPREFEPDTVLNQVMLRFWWQGYRATSIEDLVRATGVKPGSLYSAFPGGKRALFL